MAKNRVKGILVEIGGDTSALEKALSKVNGNISSLSKELKDVNSLLKLDPKNTELVSQKQENLTKNISETSKKLKSLEDVQDQVYQKWQNYIKLQPKINEVTTSIENTKKELEKLKEEQKKAQEQFDKGEITEEQYNQICQKVKECKNNLSELKEEQKELNKTTVPTESYQAYQREIIETKNKLNSLKAEASNWTKAGKSIEEFGNKVTNISNKIDNLGNTLTTRLTLPIVGVATAMVSASKEFETAFTGVEKTVDGTAEQMEELRQGIKNMSKEIPSTTTEISAVAEAAGQLGIKTEDILSFTRVMIDLGNSTNLSAEEAASSLAKFANVTKMSAKDYDKLGSTIVALGNNFATTEADIVAMATYLASTGELAGLSQSQILSLATAMSSVGIEAEAGGSAMSKLLKRIQVAVETGSEDLKDFAKVAGMSTKEFKKAFEEDAVKGLSAFISGLNDTKRNGKSAIAILESMDIKEVRLSNTILSLANASEVMNNAVELGSKAWEENTALTNEANKRYQTLDSRLQTTKNKIVDMATNMGNKLTPKVNKLLDGVDGLIDKFDNLSDEEIDNIINIGKFVMAVGPAIKIVGTLGKGIGTVSKGFGTFSQAIAVAKNNTTSTSESVNKLAGVLNSLTSPFGLATISITALIGTLGYLAIKQSEATQKTRELAEETKNQKQTYEEYNKSIDETTSNNLAQIDSVSRLKEELKTLVDENGKVKEGYKNRVSFILNELNKALGTEYGLNGDIIQSYKDLQGEIDETIEKKRAEIVLKADEEKFAKARETETEAVRKQKETLDELGISIEEARDKYQKLKEKKEEFEKSGNIYSSEYLDTGKQMTNLKNLIEAYENAGDTIKQCIEDKKEYENNYALWTEKKYSEIGKTVVGATKNWTDASIQQIRDGIIQEQTSLAKYQQMYKDTGSEISEQQVKQSQQNLENLANELAERTKTIGTLGIDEISAWKTLADSSYEEYKKALSKVGPTTQEEIQKATGVIVEDNNIIKATGDKAYGMTENFDKKLEIGNRTKVELDNTATTINNDTSVGDASEELAKDVDTNFNNNIDGWTWGWDLVKNIYNGLTNTESKNWISKGASSIASIIKSILGFSLPEKGPLSDFDTSMPDMIDLMSKGINDNKGKVINSAERLANDLYKTLNYNINFPQIHDFGKLQGKLSNKIIDSTKTVYTTPQIIFNVQELDEAKLQQCFDYINRKFGSNY